MAPVDLLKGAVGQLRSFKGDAADWPTFAAEVDALLACMRMAEDDALRQMLARDAKSELDALADEPLPKEGSTTRSKALSGQLEAALRARSEKKGLQLYTLLLTHTTGAPQKLVMQFRREQDGAAAWKTLVNKYERKDLARQSSLQEQLVHSKLGASQDPD